MKTLFRIAVLAVLLVAPGVCFALWDLDVVTKERAKELGMEVRLTAVGPKHVKAEVEFKAEGALKNFTEVEMSFRQDDKPTLHAALREDRSKPGRVAVSFTADAAQLDKFTLQVTVPFRDGGAGGTIHEIRVKDFVEPKTSPKDAKTEQKVLTSAEAIKQRSKEKVTVQFKVTATQTLRISKSNVVGKFAGFNEDCYLMDGDSFSVQLLPPVMDTIRRLGIEPDKHFKGKVVQVTGLLQPGLPGFGTGQFQIVVTDLTQFEVVGEAAVGSAR